MSETTQKWTPGPWARCHESRSRDKGIWAMNECVYVAHIYDTKRQGRGEEWEANAMLISLAPDMAKLLRRTVQSGGDIPTGLYNEIEALLSSLGGK